MGKTTNDKKRLEKATALLALGAVRENDTERQTRCLETEEFTSLLEKSATEQEMALYRSHLVGCSSCYRQWLLLSDEEEKSKRGVSSHKRWMKKYSYIGSALAVAASIAVFLNIREPEQIYMHQADEKVLEEIETVKKEVPSVSESVRQLPRTVTAEQEKILQPENRQFEQQERVKPLKPSKKKLRKAKKPNRVSLDIQAGSTSDAEAVQKNVAPSPVRARAIIEKKRVHFGKWIADIKDGCMAGRKDSDYWRQLNNQAIAMDQKGEIVLDQTQQILLKGILPILSQMEESVVPEQCEQIMVLVAQEVKKR
jgi:hypothetical protein